MRLESMARIPLFNFSAFLETRLVKNTVCSSCDGWAGKMSLNWVGSWAHKQMIHQGENQLLIGVAYIGNISPLKELGCLLWLCLLRSCLLWSRLNFLGLWLLGNVNPNPNQRSRLWESAPLGADWQVYQTLLHYRTCSSPFLADEREKASAYFQIQANSKLCIIFPMVQSLLHSSPSSRAWHDVTYPPLPF